jgi:hypothetical protein
MSASRASLTRLWNYREQASGIVPGSAGGGWPARIGAVPGVSVRSFSSAVLAAQMARAAMTSTACRVIAV